ncbi:MAG: NusA-like transcription termination signal-binding factor [Candidatus Nanoarchaeia archaeon]|nr:NusA-like transcription termination signal-binding factor [Candidatus Nanoarchaeia archaeon]
MKYGIEEINYINFMERVTKTKVKDCYIDKKGILTFITDEGEIGRAIGKAGSNIKKVAASLKKQIKVVEFNKIPEKFVENLINPIKGKVYKDEKGTILIEVKGLSDKANLLGKNKQNLVDLNELVKKYFKNIEIKVV